MVEYQNVIFQNSALKLVQLSTIIHRIFESLEIPFDERKNYFDLMVECVLSEIVLEICERQWREDREEVITYFKLASIQFLTTKRCRNSSRKNNLESKQLDDSDIEHNDQNQTEPGFVNDDHEFLTREEQETDGISEYGKELLAKYRRKGRDRKKACPK